jgi:hypothetical protein
MTDKPEYVDEDRMREMFAEERILERAASGSLIAIVAERNLPTPDFALPPGTQSQMVYYYDKFGEPIAVAHQYALPNGTLGASGQPDPKMLRIGDKLYKVPNKLVQRKRRRKPRS